MYELGISSIPADRQKHGLVLDFSVEDNLLLQNISNRPYSFLGTLNRRAIHAHATELIEKFDVRPRGCETASGRFSFGRQPTEGHHCARGYQRQGSADRREPDARTGRGRD